MAYVMINDEAYEIDMPESEAQARKALSEADISHAEIWAGVPDGEGDNYLTGSVLFASDTGALARSAIAKRALATMPASALRSLEWTGFNDIASVAADIERIKRGEHEAVLAECLDGSDDGSDDATAWREYVAHLRACAERDD